MDSDTIILMSLLTAALSWWLVISIREERQTIKLNKRDEIDRIERTKRVRRLMNKLGG